jgi:hypothetical protein
MRLVGRSCLEANQSKVGGNETSDTYDVVVDDVSFLIANIPGQRLLISDKDDN